MEENVMQEPQKNHGVIGALIGVVVLLAVALIGVIVWIVVNVFVNSPEARIGKGFANWAKEAKAGESLLELVGFDEIEQKALNQAMLSDVSLDVTFPMFDIPTIGIDVENYRDVASQKENVVLDLSVRNIELMQMQMAADRDNLYVACPKLLEDTYHIGMTDLSKNFNSSVWSELLGWELEEDLDLSIWPEEDEEQLALDEFVALLNKDFAVIFKNMTAQEDGTAIEIQRNGKTITCDGIVVVLKKDDINKMLDDMQEEFRSGKYGEILKKQFEKSMSDVENMDEIWEEALTVLDGRVESDVRILFYLDNKNRIVHMATPETLKLDTSDTGIAFAVDFKGTDRTVDEVSGMVKLVTAEASDSVNVTFETGSSVSKTACENTGKFVLESYNSLGETNNLNMEYAVSWDLEQYDFELKGSVYDEYNEMSLSAEGAFKDIKKGESYTLEIGSAEIVMDDEKLMKLSGKIAVSPMDEEVKIPEESVDLLGMTEDEVMDMIYEIAGNVEGMYSSLGSLIW